jgi:Bacteriophage T4-like portal protein (Gp20)
MQIFGFEIKRSKEQELPSVVTPSPIDTGSTVINTGVNAGGYYGMVMDLEGTIKNENDLIRRYREVSQYSDCDGAIEDIVNEAIVADEDKTAVEIVLDDVKISEPIKKKIIQEFDNVLRLLKFEDRAHEIFRTWYIDGRLYYQILIDENNIKQGIVELRYIDPRKIRRIKNIKKEKTSATGVEVVKEVEEYYLYNDKGITEQTTQGVKLGLDSVVYAPSGYVDQNTGMMMSYLHKAIKPVNQLKMIEDSLVIYRISRAPERRIFYIDVGNLPKLKAEQYVTDIMNKFRNKIVYDATTGETRDDRRHLSMMEDFWMPRREGGKGTEITTLPGGQNLGEIQDIEYFQQKLYHALNVPISRLQQQQGFSIGRSTEISRDEVKFNKFIVRLRKKFSALFNNALRVQLIAKGIIRADEWDDMVPHIKYDYLEDNHYSELKDSEILLQRLQMLQQAEPYIGKYYSMNWARKNILRLNDEDIEQMEEEIEQEQEQYIAKAEHDGTMAGATQAAQQVYLQQNAPEGTNEMPTDGEPQDDEQTQEQAPQQKTSSGSWPN